MPIIKKTIFSLKQTKSLKIISDQSGIRTCDLGLTVTEARTTEPHSSMFEDRLVSKHIFNTLQTNVRHDFDVMQQRHLASGRVMQC